MAKLNKPNWKKSNLNISATLAEFLGASNKNKILPILEKELKKNYKNVVFICFDGMGINPLKINLDKNDFLRKNIKKVLLSTFPSTTTNATTALACNLLPREHGWLGWSLHFNEINRNVDVYLRSDSQTGEKVDYVYPIADNSNCYFDNVKSEYNVTLVAPSFMQSKTKNKIAIENEIELCEEIKKWQTMHRRREQQIFSLPKPVHGVFWKIPPPKFFQAAAMVNCVPRSLNILKFFSVGWEMKQKSFRKKCILLKTVAVVP